jgi:hypothetical protein
MVVRARRLLVCYNGVCARVMRDFIHDCVSSVSFSDTRFLLHAENGRRQTWGERSFIRTLDAPCPSRSTRTEVALSASMRVYMKMGGCIQRRVRMGARTVRTYQSRSCTRPRRSNEPPSQEVLPIQNLGA